MSKILKIGVAVTMLLGLGACAVVPAPYGYAGPDVAVVVRPAPYYVGPRPYYYGPSPYGGYGYGHGYGYRHW
jgi:hypothetical protein